MTTAAPSTINAAVASVAQQYGVPSGIWQDVAFTESGYDPNAIGDSGTSFGLFQLHIGGQLPAQYASNPNVVLDPTLNAQIAMPAIAAAWNNLQSSFNPNDPSWWQQFAAQSGHPGGAPGQAVTNAEAAKLQANYGGGGNSQQDACLACGAKGSSAYNQCAAQIAIGFVPDCAKAGFVQSQQDLGAKLADPVSALLAPLLAPITAGLSNALVHTGLFLVALILVGAGLWVVVQQ